MNEQGTEPIVEEYDWFVVGQVDYDTNIILLDKGKLQTSDDLCYDLAIKNPDKRILYKQHPAEKKLNIVLKQLPNVRIVTSNLYDIFAKTKEVHTISSTVGIEAQLNSVPVVWHSNTHIAEIDLLNKENQLRFINAALKYSFKGLKENMLTKVTKYF